MSRRILLLWCAVAVGCNTLGGARIVITFENETETQCVRVSARAPNGTVTNASPNAIPRADDRLVVGLQETPELVGEVEITVARFSSRACTGTAFASETKTVTVTRNQSAEITFHYVGTGGQDGGDDGGVDAGVDAGCDPLQCTAPDECQQLPGSCSDAGTCAYVNRTNLTPCDGGVCVSGRCAPDDCRARGVGAACDDGLLCTSSSACTDGGVCVAPGSACPTPALCQRLQQPIACESAAPTSCVYEAAPGSDGTGCGADSLCFGGQCRPWLPTTLMPRFFNLPITAVPYPTAGLTLASVDGGTCDVVISTSGAAPSVVTPDCGAPATVSGAVVADGGVALITLTGLTVGPNVRLSFVGTRAAQVLVLGSANVQGLVSVAPTVAGQVPAGSNPGLCTTVENGAMSKDGAGGGGFGGAGGNGGESGGNGGSAAGNNAMVLRGGCSGGTGFRVTGASPGGQGGGALNLIVAGTLTVGSGGALTASGGGGQGGTANDEGGGGGGSGGMVFVEARTVNLSGGAVTSNGGSGGEGGLGSTASAAGTTGAFVTNTAATTPDTTGGGNGGNGGAGSSADGTNGGGGGGSAGGGGGGGGVGVIYVRAATTCTLGGGVLSGSQPEAINCN